MLDVQLNHLHTYFLFPFSVNSSKVMEANEQTWANTTIWLDGIERWVESCSTDLTRNICPMLGRWQRAAYSEFGLDSPAYADMVFFHPFVRRVFFDTRHATGEDPTLTLLRCFILPLNGKSVCLKGTDEHGLLRSVDVSDLRLFLFANGIGILSIGIEAHDIAVKDALWINEMMRKVYPSSGRQRREGRAPSEVSLWVRERESEREIARESFQGCSMLGFEPPLSSLVQTLLYFLDYSRNQYEQVLDERMIVYSYISVDNTGLPSEYVESEEYQQLISRFLYVDRVGEGYRYEPGFTREQMSRQLYTRWAHEGTYYGYTNYSSISITLGMSDRGEHRLAEGFLIHRMFCTRYYLMTIIALFYRATLLMFNEKSALVSRDLYHDQQRNRMQRENIANAKRLRGEFLHFSNYWWFEELSNKEEENEHFAIQSRDYGLQERKEEIEQELEAMDASLSEYYQSRNTSAVNRLAMLSLIFGAGAVLTGFFGMNFGRGFAQTFFEPAGATWPHLLAIVVVAVFSLGAIVFGGYVIAANWNDYGKILNPRQRDEKRP